VELAWRFCRFSRTGRISFDCIRDEAITPDALAKSALRGELLLRDSEARNAKANDPLDGSSNRKAVEVLKLGDASFMRIIEMTCAKLASIKRMAILTALVSLLTIVSGAYPTWEAAYDNSNISGAVALFHAGDVLLNRVALGLSVCTLMYAVHSFFAGLLAGRKLNWKDFYSDAQAKLSQL
jgi:hypothetical protein